MDAQENLILSLISNICEYGKSSQLTHKKIQITAANAWDIYTIRARLFVNDPLISQSFTILLKNLKELDENDTIQIISVTLGEKLYLIFTNSDYSKLYGILEFHETMIQD